MRVSRLLFLLLFLVFPASAQQGTITYDRIVKLNIELPPEMESMRDQIPTENKTRMTLHFNEWESVWQAAEEQEEGGDRSFGGGGMMFRMSRGAREQNVTYINHEDGLMTERRDFMGRTFLIKDEQPTLAWKLTGEQSEFSGYLVQRATAVRDSSTVEAWFSPQIPVTVGPGPFGGLPGAILVLTIDDGQTTFTATDIALAELPEGTIVAPEEGKEVTQAEFDEIMEEKMKEMEAQFGGRGRNGARFIIRGND